ncbi:hypothetical protein ACHAXA_000826 [Cyclostephanos tholiformis]|uniref:Uncharacterized protein n=1 Tax=Cyclostephanos tholiformis TaxID=382380 RepID=A0ABD3RWT4_9STRA
MTPLGSLSRQNNNSIESSSNSVVCVDEAMSSPSVAAHVTCARVTGVEGMRRESSRLPQLHSAHSIRQIDADILEQGVEEKWGAALADFDHEGRRMEPIDSNVSLVDLDDDDVARREFEVCNRDVPSMVESVDESIIDLSPSSATYNAPYSHAGRTCAMTASSSCDNLSLPSIIEHSSCHVPQMVPDGTRPNAYNRSISESFILLNDLTEQKQEIDHAALLLRIASGRAHNRSDSFDRRMSESAQFAEAVGEEPDSLLLQKIVEDDSSSDFDDNEIDEVGDMFMEHKDEQDELMDYGDRISNEERTEVNAVDEKEMVESISIGIVPTCVSMDVTKMSFREEECPIPEVPLLPGPLEVEIPSATPATHPLSQSISNMHPHEVSSSKPPHVNWTFTRQFSSALNLEGKNGHSRSMSFPSSDADFAYRGIRANPPEITKKGVARGNYAQMHRKAWLEVSDKRHRYGKNLRMYYKHWEDLGHPFHMFFDWLDSKGEASGNPLPSLSEIPRPVLDSDTVLYITDSVITATYALDIVVNSVDGSANILDRNGNSVNTGREGWIFVLRDNVFYGSQKVTASKSPGAGSPSNGSPSTDAVIPRQRFHHSTFFGGKAVASAGIFLTDERGLLTQLWPHSGHYRPGEAHMQRVLFFLQQLGVELSTFMVDMQQIFKVTREAASKRGISALGDKGKGDGDLKEANETHAIKTKKIAKIGCLHLLSGQEVALFLAHKALMIEYGVFHQIHKIRRIPKESRYSVRFVLDYLNN